MYTATHSITDGATEEEESVQLEAMSARKRPSDLVYRYSSRSRYVTFAMWVASDSVLRRAYINAFEKIER